MGIEELIGRHILTGVDMDAEDIKEEYGDRYESCNVCRFTLDSVTYAAIEDPDDGYRSSMRELVVSPSPTKNEFPPCAVLACLRNKRNEDILDLIDEVTGKVVLSVGTDNTDDYYPCFVSEYTPENMACNIGHAHNKEA